ncbi:hypothetical protein J5X84_36845 [Streptosporangiaceae bacterium NEAU-GS5]|nr:hypothetical protein [Streptosporangiaceae bacterium NEAU-GS5]
MSPLISPRREAVTVGRSWTGFYAVARLYVDLLRVAGSICRPAPASIL